MSKYEVRGVKTHRGHEGEPLAECGLYRDGVKVAVYTDGDWGGEAQFWFVDEKAPKVEVKGLDFSGKPISYMGTPEEALLEAHCASIPPKPCEWQKGDMNYTTPDIFVGDTLINDYNRAKDMQKKTLFIINKNGKELEYQLNAPYTPEVKASLEKQHGANLVKILNTEFVNSADAEALKQKKADARLKRQCKNATLFRLQGEANGKYWVCHRPYSPEIKIHLQTKYGSKLVEIINETLAA